MMLSCIGGFSLEGTSFLQGFLQRSQTEEEGVLDLFYLIALLTFLLLKGGLCTLFLPLSLYTTSNSPFSPALPLVEYSSQLLIQIRPCLLLIYHKRRRLRRCLLLLTQERATYRDPSSSPASTRGCAGCWGLCLIVAIKLDGGSSEEVL